MDRKYYVWNALVFGLSPALDYFQYFMSDVGRILSDQDIPNAIKLDKVLCEDVYILMVGWSGAFIPIMTYETKSIFSETATHAEQNAF